MFASQRQKVYSLFQLYLKHRGERREFDVAERCDPISGFVAILLNDL
jgi:hypothetical protein